MSFAPSREARVPRRALGFSLSALAAPILAAFFAPDSLASYSALLWLTALLPAFVLAYYKGWRGVATSLALGMATLSVAHAVASFFGHAPPDLLLAVVAVYLAIGLALGWLAEQVHRDREEAADMAFTDLLTGLPNRRHADIFLRDAFAAAQRGRRVAVVLFDLDDFKGYTDSHRHSAGDEALRTFGRVLKNNTRRMNLGARYGGEEFLAVLAGSNPAGAAIFAGRVRVALENEGLGDPPLTVSAGIALYEEGVPDPAELLRAADAALYEAKRGGRNQVRVAGGIPSTMAPPPPPAGARGGVREEGRGRRPRCGCEPLCVGPRGRGRGGARTRGRRGRERRPCHSAADPRLRRTGDGHASAGRVGPGGGPSGPIPLAAPADSRPDGAAGCPRGGRSGPCRCRPNLVQALRPRPDRRALDPHASGSGFRAGDGRGGATSLYAGARRRGRRPRATTGRVEADRLRCGVESGLAAARL